MLIFLLLALWLGIIFINVIAKSIDGLIVVSPLFNFMCGIVCHQLPERTIAIGDSTLLVCARCTGIYFGGLASSLFLIFSTRILKLINTKLFILSSLPVFLDIIFYNTEFYNYSRSIAFSTGLLLGSIGFLYFYTALNHFYFEITSKRIY